MTKGNKHCLAEGNVTKPELVRMIWDILGSGGDEYTAYEIMEGLKGMGKNASTLRIAHMIRGMDGVEVIKPIDSVASRLHYIYRRKW